MALPPYQRPACLSATPGSPPTTRTSPPKRDAPGGVPERIYGDHGLTGCSMPWPMGAEFEADLIRMRTREGMKLAKAKAKGRLRRKKPKLSRCQESQSLPTGQSWWAHRGRAWESCLGSAAPPFTGPSSEAEPAPSLRRGFEPAHPYPPALETPKRCGRSAPDGDTAPDSPGTALAVPDHWPPWMINYLDGTTSIPLTQCSR